MCKTIIYTKAMLKMKKYIRLGEMIYFTFKNKMMNFSYTYFLRKKKLNVHDKSRYSKKEKFRYDKIEKIK